MTRWILMVSAMTAACGTEPAPEANPPILAEDVVALRQAVVFPAIDGNGLTAVHSSALDRRESLSMSFDGRVHDAQIVGDTIVASLRDEGAVSLVQVVSGALVEVGRIPVGPTPLGIAVDEASGRVWVAVALSDELVEIDLTEQTVVRRTTVGSQPRWVRYLDTGEVFVGSTQGETFHLVDAETGLPRAVTLPDLDREKIPQSARVTGAADTVQIGGAPHLIIPSLYADNRMMVSIKIPEDVVDPNVPAYYVSQPEAVNDLGRVVPTLVVLNLYSGEVTEVIAPTGTRLTEERRRLPLRSLFSDLSVPEGEQRVLLTMPGSDAVLVVDLHATTVPSSGPYRVILAGTLHTDGGPVAFRQREGDLWVHNFVSETAAPLMRGLIVDADPMADLRLAATRGTFNTERTPEQARGRALFHSAEDPRVTTPHGSVSCGTCHFDGGSDGLTWHVEAGPRQTPSLGGEVSSTAPMTWTNEVESLKHEVMITATGRMAAAEMTDALAQDIAAFVDSVPVVDVGTPAEAGLDLDAVARGKQIFKGSAACADCHSGPALTDNATYPMFDEPGVTTPALRSLRASPPYLHDGRAPSLQALVEIAEAGGMGRTDHLSAPEKADLVAYLASL